MSRPLRIDYPGAWHHVMGRGAGKKAIFRNDNQREIFIKLLGEVRVIFDVEIHAYCLMNNHYHLLIRSPQATLARALRHLNGVYTQRFNRLVGTDGPLFRGRYKSILVDSDNYLLQVSRYIHRNLLDSNLSQKSDSLLWSSLPAYTGKASAGNELETKFILGMIGKSNTKARYKKYVDEGVDDETAEFYSKSRQSPLLGDEAFIEKISKFVESEKLSPEIAGAKRIKKPPTIKRILQCCAEFFGVTPKDLRHSVRGIRNQERTIAISLCRAPGGHRLEDIAKQFGGISYSGVSAAISRLNRELEADPKLRKMLDKIKSEL
ncbi:MAG: hypothetical protein COV66_10895 [Nitrospinae bacterium CG11_big_fil_rev_8_21_14_0_20_45_15]|nr:MAG: hypothetical protein COV66_10895 [Nitrospinae bacterium CG11_big_fil_rev_8_21_14_0_20_45_15]